MEVIITGLKGALVLDEKEVRGAALRVLRYLINDEGTKKKNICEFESGLSCYHVFGYLGYQPF